MPLNIFSSMWLCASNSKADVAHNGPQFLTHLARCQAVDIERAAIEIIHCSTWTTNLIRDVSVSSIAFSVMESPKSV